MASQTYEAAQRQIKIFAGAGRLDFLFQAPGLADQRVPVPFAEKFEPHSLAGKELTLVRPAPGSTPNRRQIKIVWDGHAITTGWCEAKNGGQGYFFGTIDPSNRADIPNTPEEIFSDLWGDEPVDGSLDDRGIDDDIPF